jgi:hypothetical protein
MGESSDSPPLMTARGAMIQRETRSQRTRRLIEENPLRERKMRNAQKAHARQMGSRFTETGIRLSGGDGSGVRKGQTRLQRGESVLPRPEPYHSKNGQVDSRNGQRNVVCGLGCPGFLLVADQQR